MLELWQRVPETWIAMMFGCAGGWLFLKLQPKSISRDIVSDKLSGAVLAFVLFSRFSGILLHPSLNIRDNLMSVIGGAPPNGWLLGLIVGTAYLVAALRKEKAFDQRTLKLVVQTLIVGSIPFFAYHAYRDLYPYRLEGIVRLLFAVVLYMASRSSVMYPNRLLAAGGVVLFATSLMVPHFDTYLLFDEPQWIFLLMLVASLSVEAIHDIKGRKASTPADLSNDGQIQEDFDCQKTNLD